MDRRRNMKVSAPPPLLPTVPGSPSVPPRPNGDAAGAAASHTNMQQQIQQSAQEPPRRRLQDAMATALSVDHWTSPPESRCQVDDDEGHELSVNFICPHPPITPATTITEEDAHGSAAMSASTPCPAPPPDLPKAARFQEIFVDLCALHVSSYDAASRHVLDSRFDSFLGPGEREFKKAVLELIRGNDTDEEGGVDDGVKKGGLSKEARETSAYRRLERMLRKEMGLGALDERQEQRVRKIRGLRASITGSSSRGLRHVSSASSLEDDMSQQESQRQQNAAGSLPHKSTRDTASSTASERSGEKFENDSDYEDAADPRVCALRELIAQIRSKADLFRDFALTGESILSTKVFADILPDALTCDDISELLSEYDNIDDSSLKKEMEKLQHLLRPPGHVFCINGSVCDLSCDAFLCPASISSKTSRKKDTVAGTIFRRWYEEMQKNNAKLLDVLKGEGSAQGVNCNGRPKGRRRRSRSRSNSNGSDDDFDGNNRGMFSSIPQKHYDEFDRVVTPLYWPWADFWRKDSFEASTAGLFRTPLLVAGEVSVQRSSVVGSAQAVPSAEDHIDALLGTVRQFFLVSLKELRREQPRPRANRERYLLAVPVVGSGFGGAGDITGQICRELIICLSELVQVHDDVDCVIVCADVATFSHTQNLRFSMYERMLRSSSGEINPGHQGALSAFCLFTNEQKQKCAELAKLSSKGQLSLFLGAGVSMGAGLPSWKSLLFAIEDQFTLTGKKEERMLGLGVDPLLVADWLDVLCKSRPDRDGQSEDIKRRIASFLNARSGCPSLLMYLLSALPVKSLVTQNYDQLIERAFECRNIAEKKSKLEVGEEASVAEALSVIPYKPVKGAGRFLLKMHGDISDPDSIVVTSSDYRTYETGSKKALAGLVQANLLTTHILFVGFGLTDPNFLKILAEVRKAMGTSVN